MTDCASTIFGIIRHYEHNFHDFSEKSTASIINIFWLVLEPKIRHLLIMSTSFGHESHEYKHLFLRLFGKQQNHFLSVFQYIYWIFG